MDIVVKEDGSPSRGMLPKKKYPPALDRALLTERYEALECTFSIMSDAWNHMPVFGLECI